MIADDLPAVLQTLPPAWRARLPGWTAARWRTVADRVREVSDARPIAPADPLRALRFFAPADTKVVIVGQDPYPRPGHADGLAFSSAQGVPHSLRRIFQVLAADRPGWVPPRDGRLDGWAAQGVLLLNPVLSVEVGRSGAHMHCGWQALTSELVQTLCRLDKPPVFLLWGLPANGFFDDALPADTAPPQALRSRHPSHDIRRLFMGDGSHFAATRQWVDWWALPEARAARATLTGSPEGCPSG